MAKSNKIIKNYLYNTLYQILVLISPLITMPYISRVLGATGVGVYSYAQSIATYFVLLGAVGTTLYGQREIAYVQDDPKRRTEVFWQISSLRFVAVILCTVVYSLIFTLEGEYAIVYRILILEVLANAFDISWFFMGMENFKTTVIRNSVIKVLGILLVFIFVKTPEDVPAYAICMTLPIFAGNISLWFGLKKYLVKLDKFALSGVLAHLKPVLILFLPQIASEVYLVLDKTMIGLLASNIDQVGYYTQAQKIIKIILMIVTSLGTVMLPAMSAAFAQGKQDEINRSIKNAFQFVFMLAFPLLFGVVAVADMFVPIFFGEGYDQIIPLMKVIAPILIIIGASNVIGRQFLLPTKQQRAFTISIIAGAVINFLLNLVLIRQLDAIGASIATILAELAVTLVQIWYVRKQLPVGSCLCGGLRYAAYGFVMYLAVRAAGHFLPTSTLSLIVMILVGVLVYGAMLILTKDSMIVAGLQMVKKKTGAKAAM